MANAFLAIILSFFIFGLGQFYCGSFLRGLLIFIGAVVVGSLALFIPLIGWILFLIYWIWNMWDAYSLANTTGRY
ncbi:MAG: hypothetical protein LBU81_05990 [Methanosarcinales archaeon]|jgi:TM2 domain-containing membrane protein YozV|nr:hypothetical protein [Methanosarcinales archaeon]